MIYRIAIGTIVDGKWKFSHHATDDELKRLRISSDGKVFKLQTILTQEGNEDYIGWLDVSETHKVEFGFVHKNKNYFHNDILNSLSSLTSYDKKGTKWLVEYDNSTASFWITSTHDSEMQISVLCPGLDEMLSVIGNVNENSELMEEKE